MATTAPVIKTEQHVFQDGIVNNGVSIVGNIATVSAAATALPTSVKVIKIAVSGTTSTAMTLAAGSEGQEIVLMMTAVGTGSSDAVITAPLYGSNTTLTFGAVGDTVSMICLSGEWFITSNISVTVG